MSGFSIPYLPTAGSLEGTAAALARLAPQLAIALAYWAREGANPKALAPVALANSIMDGNLLKDALALLAPDRGTKLDPGAEFKVKKEDSAPTLWGSLGDVKFDILSGPERLSAEEEVSYVQHRVIGAKPHVQFAAPGLRTVTLTLAWHSMLMDDLKARHGALAAAMAARQVLPLVVGGEEKGTYLDGLYVITAMPYEIERFWPNGRVMSMALTVKLLEWNEGGPLEPGEHAPPAAVAPGGGSTPAQNSGGTNDDMTRRK